jgi:fumarate hydratase class II
MKFREEQDTMGMVLVPEEAYYGGYARQVELGIDRIKAVEPRVS